MAAGGNRWWGSRSEFPWEQDALDFIRSRMPDAEPYRAWTTFTFTAQSGHVREVDLLILTPAGLFLVEIKSHPGKLTNSGSSWMFQGHDRVRTIENPLHLTDRKAKELKGQLEWALRRNGPRGLRVPFVQAAVFLSDQGLRSHLDEVQRAGVYARDKGSGLDRVWEDLLRAAPRSAHDRNLMAFSKQLPKLLTAIGIQGYRKHRMVGTWRLEPKAIDAGPTWEDYLAENTAMEGDHRRIRIYLSELGASREARESTRRAARREYLVLQGIDHPGIVKAEQFSDEHEAGPAVVFQHRKQWLRLDHYLAQYGEGLDVDTRLDMIRQLAEALDHAHRRHLYHRALAARSVYVSFHGAGYDPRLRISDWQAATRSGGSNPAHPGHPSTLNSGGTSLGLHVERSAEAYLAPEFLRADADSVPIDVFGLGALGYLIITGRPPAASRGELARRLADEHGLVPSAVADSITPAMDDLIREATRSEVCDRMESVRDFLGYLDLVEEELTAPDEPPDEDPFEATRGTVVAGWTVQKVLGKGSTARAFLADRPAEPGGSSRTGKGPARDTAVLKVALSDAAADRLRREAALLERLHDSRIVKLLGGPLEVGGRTLLVLEEAGQVTLADQLRRDGRLTLDELERYGDDLFTAVEYLDGERVVHRDLKPDNLAIRRLANNTTRLVLFDFSGADVPASVVRAGTPGYLDPFVGTDRRPRYDDQAERYALAVTLHEMAGAEQPSWGDAATEPQLLDPTVLTPQLAEDRFDAGLRDGLVSFFTRALHRDATKRFASLKQMRDAWRDMFRELDRERPPSIPSSTPEEPAEVEEARDQAALAATAHTLLAEAGLSPRAVSAAVDELAVSTVGQLIALPATRIQRLRGVGVSPRNELLRRAREWRRRFQVEESAADVAKDDRAAAKDVQVAGPAEAKEAARERARRLSLDEVTGRLVPKGDGAEAQVTFLVLALPSLEGKPSPMRAWAPQREIAERLQLPPADVARYLKDTRTRWMADSAVKYLRDDIVGILTDQGRVLEAGQLAAELLVRRGSGLADQRARLALAGAAVRAAIETEERLDRPRLVKRRIGSVGRVLIALSAEDDPEAPGHAELLDYAEQLGERADELARLDPLPSALAVRAALREYVTPSGLAPLPDTRLVALAAAASAHAAVTARLELYPDDLDPVRAVRLAQVAGYLGEPGITPDQLRRRVLARFPALTGLPSEPAELRKVLKSAGHDVGWSPDGKRLVTRTTGGPLSVSRSRPSGTATGLDLITSGEVAERLAAGVAEGGFLALKARLRHAATARAALCGLDGVTGIDVSAEFVGALREIVAARGKPDWTTMLGADPATAPIIFHQLIDQAFTQVEQAVRAVEGIALLHDATPLVRYRGGPALLTRLAEAARTPDETPYGLWLLCPMDDPNALPLLDDMAVRFNTPNEHLALPSGFGRAADTPAGRAS